MSSARAATPYAVTWGAWLTLLALTLIMLWVGRPALLLTGIMAKAAIITLWFMHLRHERPALSWSIAIATLATGLILFGLISVDATPR